MKKANSFQTILWAASIVFICTRYLCAAIMCAGALGDRGTYNMALETIGPFLPVMSLLCLCGALLFSLVELVITIRDRRNDKDK